MSIPEIPLFREQSATAIWLAMMKLTTAESHALACPVQAFTDFVVCAVSVVLLICM